MADSTTARVRRWIAWPVSKLIVTVLAVLAARPPILGLRGTWIADREPIASLVEKSLFLVAALVIWLGIGRLVERRRLSEIGAGSQGRSREFAFGLLLGGGLITALVALNALAGWYRVATVRFEPSALAMAVAGLTVTALFEEILFRLLLFRFVEEQVGSWIAIGLTSAVFAAAHWGNPGASSVSATALALAGAVFCLAFVATRAVWLVAGLHIGWNVGEAVLFGMPVSGVSFASVLIPSFDGPELWTGGDFGPEASVPCAVLCVAVGAGFAWWAIRHGTVVMPSRTPNERVV